MYNTREKVEKWLAVVSIVNYVINEDLTVDVNDSVNLIGKGLSQIPIQFGIIDGSFNCSWNKLTNLEGCPKVVNGNFNCSDNQLTDLENCPSKISRNFYCNNNNLTSLEGCLEVINGSFFCRENKLINLEYFPKRLGGKVFNIENNNFLEEELVNFNCDMKNIEEIFSNFNEDGNKEEFLNKVNFYKSKKENELLKELSVNSNNIKLNKKL